MLRLYFFLISLILLPRTFATTCNGNDFLEYDPQYQISYVAGFYDADEFNSFGKKKSLSKCLGPNVKMSQLVDTFVKHLKENPQIRHYHCIPELKAAIIKQWGCDFKLLKK